MRARRCGQDNDMGWVIGLGITAAVFILAAVGLAPWFAILPVIVLVAAMLFLPPLLAQRERERAEPSGVTSTQEASYEPVTDPSER
jgi:hypothetical protein